MRVLIVGDDPVFATLLEDQLSPSGRKVTTTSDGAAAVRQAVEGPADLVVLDQELPAASGMEVLRALRSQPETRALPVVLLSESDDRTLRLEALRAGADDFLTKPCDLEELTLRIDRLLGSRDAGAVALQGSLAAHPFWEVIQYIAGGDKSGFLVVRAEAGGGRLQVARGRVTAARWRDLKGREALLALAGLREGRFRFVTHQGDAEETPATGLPVAEILIEGAMLEDELAKLAGRLPATGVPLEAVAAPPPPPPAFAGVPIAAIHHRVVQRPGLRLYDLLAAGEVAAPLKVRLAVAWLIEQGAVEAATARSGERFPSTLEIDTTMLLDAVVDELLAAAHQAGLTKAILPHLILAAPAAWQPLQSLLRTLPGWERMETLQRMLGQMTTGSGASGTFATPSGKVSLHVKQLSKRGATQAAAVVAGCAGALVWLDGETPREALETVVARLESKREAAQGVLLAVEPAARRTAEELAAGTRRWQVVPVVPRSMLGLLRLLRLEPGT